MFSDLVPSRMQWGSSPDKYPGQHIVRKLLLKYEAEIGNMHWCKEQFWEQARTQEVIWFRSRIGPHTRWSLHFTRSRQAGCRCGLV